MTGIAPADRSSIRIESSNRTRPSVLFVIHDIQCRSEAQGSVLIFCPGCFWGYNFLVERLPAKSMHTFVLILYWEVLGYFLEVSDLPLQRL